MEGVEPVMIVASAAQERYLKKRRREHSLVWLFRILILVIFLGLWEVSTRAGWMDSFIFSSPSKVVATFADMWKYNSLYVHIGVTLFETLVSFFLVIVISISVAVLLWACPQVSNVLEPYLVEIGFGTAFDRLAGHKRENYYCSWYFCSYFRFGY